MPARTGVIAVSVVVVVSVVAVVAVVDVVDVAHMVVDIEPDEPTNMTYVSASVCNQAAPQSACSKETASKNIAPISMTFRTFHREMSAVKAEAP